MTDIEAEGQNDRQTDRQSLDSETERQGGIETEKKRKKQLEC